MCAQALPWLGLTSQRKQSLLIDIALDVIEQFEPICCILGRCQQRPLGALRCSDRDTILLVEVTIGLGAHGLDAV